MNILSSSVNIPCGRGTYCQLPSTFRAAAKPSVNFPCIHILCISGTFSQLSVRPWYLNFSYGSGNFHQTTVRSRDLPSTFFVSAQPSVNFRHLSIFCWTFCKLTSNFRASEGSSVNFLCIHGTFCKLLSTFLESAGPSVNILCLRRTFGRLPSIFVHPQDLPSTFRVSAGPFIRFPYDSGTFRKFRQLSVRPWDLLSTSVNFPCACSTFHQLLSTFYAPAKSSVNNLRGRRTFRQHQSTFRASAGLIVNLRQLQFKQFSFF